MRKLTNQLAGVAAFLLAVLFSPTAKANVYASNIKLNGSLTTTSGNTVQGVTITYILNEAATSGVIIKILAQRSVIQTISLTSGQPGTLKGLNSILWNAQTSSNQVVTNGYYGVSITASATGYTAWTQISDDDTNTYIYQARGIAVNNNTNSPYYGRVFVGNSASQNPTTTPGNNDTILKYNADGSFADEGPDGDGGYPIMDTGDDLLPQKLRVGGDDRLYMMDDSVGSGQVVAFDMLLTTNQIVLSPANYVNNPFYNFLINNDGWYSMDITGAGTTNALVWLGADDEDSAGIWFWSMTGGVVSSSNTIGAQAVSETGHGSLNYAPSGGLMVDSNFDIFVSQNLDAPEPTNSVCMMFANFTGGTNAFNAPLTIAHWTNGQGDSTFLDVNDTTINSRQSPTYVACSLQGPESSGLRILNAVTGATLTTLDVTNEYFVTAWDNVGNLYATSDTAEHWRVFSPPAGPNQATTLAAALVDFAPPIDITQITVSSTAVVLTFTADPTNTVGQFTLQSSGAVNGPYSPVVNVVFSQVNNSNVFTVATPVVTAPQFYRIVRSGS